MPHLDSRSETTRYTLSFHPECPTCETQSTHDASIGVWVCPYCGRLAIDYEMIDGRPVLAYGPANDEPIRTIKVLGEFATQDGLKAMLGTPYEAKDDLLALSRETTDRRWNPNRTAWTVDASAIEAVTAQLQDAGWPVVDLVQLRRDRRAAGD